MHIYKESARDVLAVEAEVYNYNRFYHSCIVQPSGNGRGAANPF
jgi:hypothetical protein